MGNNKDSLFTDTPVKKARHTAAFCIWTGIVVSLVYGIAIMLLEPVLFPILGAKTETWEYLKNMFSGRLA